MSETIEERVDRLENGQQELQDCLQRLEQVLTDALELDEVEEMDPLEEAHQRFVEEIKNRRGRTGHA